MPACACAPPLSCYICTFVSVCVNVDVGIEAPDEKMRCNSYFG
jgi:hypothetical protein